MLMQSCFSENMIWKTNARTASMKDLFHQLMKSQISWTWFSSSPEPPVELRAWLRDTVETCQWRSGFFLASSSILYRRFKVLCLLVDSINLLRRIDFFPLLYILCLIMYENNCKDSSKHKKLFCHLMFWFAHLPPLFISPSDVHLGAVKIRTSSFKSEFSAQRLVSLKVTLHSTPSSSTQIPTLVHSSGVMSFAVTLVLS